MQPPSMQPEVTITWVGHATVEFEVDGFRAITDPILTSRVVHLRRRVEVPTIDPVDAVLISHLHMDHLHLRSLRTVTDGVRVIAPRGSAKLFRSLGITQLDEVVAGDVVTLREARGDDSPAIEARVVPADHSNARGPHSRIVAEPVGYIVNTGRRSVYFAGDTDLFEGMHAFPEIDVALLPIWGWGPTLGDRHLDPTRRDRHPLDCTAARRADPLGHVHTDHAAARHPAVDRQPVRSLQRRAGRARSRRPHGRISAGWDDDDRRRQIS